ncbi:EAL domain-containing protein [uncultured Jatrophihabitans sp.]|uniref:EAL domain-containing protein n=1 Tax=uncultured Jatrophihabitans sp. TaxID=1610747 RepID=UPI0035C9B7FA
MTDTVATADDAAPPPSDPRWAEVLQRVVDQPDLLTLHAQPIVELTSGAVAGYEMLARFRGPWSAPPDQWFTAADRWGVNALLQARVLRAGIAARGSLPPDTFLTVNIDPHLLAHADIVEVLTAAPDLTRLVLELTEHTQALEGAGVADVLAQVRRSGAMLAMDDAGTGYAGLSQLLTLRPHMVKLDRELINGIDTDPVKAALVEVFGDLAGRMDTWILAEGIETESELDTLIRLGVPLGQGWALARPAPSMLAALAPTIVDHIRTTALRSSLDGYVASLVRPVEVGLQRAGSAVSLDGNGVATAVRVDDGAWLPATLVSPSTLVVDAARRAMTRDLQYRYAPLVCTDGQGQVIGTIGIDDLLLALCSSGSPATGR